MSAENLLVILLVGLIAGWLAGQIVRGTGYGLVADIAIGIVGGLNRKLVVTGVGHSPRQRHSSCHYRRHDRRHFATPRSEAYLQARSLVVAETRSPLSPAVGWSCFRGF